MNSYKTYLMKKTGTGSTASYEKLIDIKDFPELFGTPEKLEKTTLSDRARTYEEGIEESETLEFTANYSLTDFNTLRALKGTETEFAIYFGASETQGVVTPDGSDGKFGFKGYLSVSIVGKGINEVREMKISIAQSTPIDVIS